MSTDQQEDRELCPRLNHEHGHFFWVSSDLSSCFPAAESVFGLSQAGPCVCAPLSQDGWGPEAHSCVNVAWRPPLSLSSFAAGKVSLASVMRNAYSVISSGQGPASSLLLFWTFYPQRRKCPTGGPAIPCLRSSGLRSSLVLIHFIQDNTFYSPNWSPVCFQRRSEVQWWPGTQREKAQLGALLMLPFSA